MANRQLTRPAGSQVAGRAEQTAVLELVAQREAAVSDPPLFVPQAAGGLVLLLGLLLSPKEPEEPKTPKKV